MTSERADVWLARVKEEERAKASGSGAAKGSDTALKHGSNDKEKDNRSDADKGKDKDGQDDKDEEIITIKIKDSARYQRETSWTVKKSDLLWTHLQNYARSINLNYDPFPGPLRFVTYDGEQINKHHTPESLEMENGDVVDVLQEQSGGQY
ncbi:uncharacterized protein PG998_011686 [Apiospora kogelbergensis]|uniref:uncharacterized protein n=1 Tax=Apiospora kogelbergensis TaxID=1337665 RepID=UPI0031325411